MDTPSRDRGLVIAATSCAMAVLASQLAGKAARDAIFLQQFAVTNLPLLLAVSSALAIGMTFVFARRLRRGIPVRVVQIANVTSAGLLLVEWALLDVFPRPVAIVIFMHQTLLGPILVSGFWSVVSECFDPRTARRVLATVATGATIGALLGAVLAERCAALLGTNMLLPLIATLELVATWRLSRVGRGCPLPDDDAPVLREAVHNITRVSLLRRLAIVTVIVTIAAALLDYVFKANATAIADDPDDLARIFATFHGVVSILTAIVQWIFGRWALQQLGLARTLATLPGAVIAFGVAAVVAPGIGTYVALRGAENVVRNSLYRDAYEVFYTPLLAAERRATKTIIDVGVERFGDVLGGLAVLAIIALAPGPTPLLVVAIALSAVGMLVALQAQRSYVEALERSLIAHAIDFEKDEPRDRTTRATVEMFVSRARTPKPVAHARDLAEAIHAFDRPTIVRLAPVHPGQIVDAIRDTTLPVDTRAELPALLADAATPMWIDFIRAGLVACLADPVLAVRAPAAGALAKLCARYPDLALDSHVVFDGVRRELTSTVSPEAIDYLATLLALTLPAEPIRTAFHGISSTDPALRGVALEYLENVLPGDIVERMWIVLAIEAPTTTHKRPLEDVLAELLRPLPERAEAEIRATQIDLPRAQVPGG